MSAAVTVYVPRDAAALAVGADAVADAVAAEAAARGLAVRLVRNGSRGMFWLEPLVEVATPQGRLAYGPVAPEDVPGLFEAGFQSGGAHPLALGPTEEIAYLKRQERLTFARVGVTDPVSLEDYEAHEGYAGLRRALEMTPEAIVQAVLDSGLRGRGGAAFPAGIKWKTVAAAPGRQKYVVCNADEGDSGTFSDRMTMEGDPFMLIEGMTTSTSGSSQNMPREPLRASLTASPRDAASATTGLGHGVGADGQRRGVARNVDGDRGTHRVSPAAAATSASKRCGVTRACGVSSIISAGDEAHRPRQ